MTARLVPPRPLFPPCEETLPNVQAGKPALHVRYVPGEVRPDGSYSPGVLEVRLAKPHRRELFVADSFLSRVRPGGEHE